MPQPEQATGEQSNISALEFSDDGLQLAVAWENGLLGLYDLKDFDLDAPIFRSVPEGITDLSWHPSGERLAGANREFVTLWDEQGQALIELRGAPRSADTPFDAVVAFSPDGAKLAATQWDNTIRVWKSTSPPLGASERTKLMLLSPSEGVFCRTPHTTNPRFCRS